MNAKITLPNGVVVEIFGTVDQIAEAVKKLGSDTGYFQPIVPNPWLQPLYPMNPYPWVFTNVDDKIV